MASPAVIGSRYEIRGIVGRGGMGLVYKAFDRVVGREVALKTLVDVQGRVAVEMFYKEWRILASLHHPNIIEIFDIGEFQDGGVTKPFFVMPLLPGMTLDHILRLPGQQLSGERLGEIVSQTCRGLQAIHDNGLVHRDVKPSNIFVMEFNAVKVIDFGVAHLLGGATVTGLKGTVNYMAPEQILSQECSAASDVFSLGVLCYEALCGTRPFQGGNSEAIFHAIVHQNPAPIYEVNPAVSQSVSRVIHKALAKHPRQRYTSALEFGDTLQRALRGEQIPALDPSRIQPRIQRAIRAFEQGNYQMATEILSDLEAAGHIDPALRPLRKQIDQALQKSSIRDLLMRAQMGLEEEEFTLALQNVEAALKIEPANEDGNKLRARIQDQIAERGVLEWLRGAEEAIERYAFSRARQLLGSVLEVRPGDPQATALLETLESREQVYRAARQEKEKLYKAAREAWENCEFASAADQLERVLQLESSAPDTSSPDSGTNYSNFLTLVRSAQMIVENTRAVAMGYIAVGKYEAAAEVCQECTAKYPGHPVPQGLALLAESERRREMLTRIGDTVHAIGDEPDLEKKLELLRHAIEAFPNEPLFEQWMRPIRDRLAQTKTVAARAQAHEERGRFREALEQWQMLESIYPDFAGLRENIRRIEARTVDPGSRAKTLTAGSAVAAGYAPASAATDSAPTTVVLPSRPVAEPLAASEAAPQPPSEPAIEAVKQPQGDVGTGIGKMSETPGPSRTSLRPSLPRSTQPLKYAGWALGAAIAVVMLIVAGIIVSARNKPVLKTTSVLAPPASRARVVLHSGDADAVIRIGDATVALAAGVAQTELAPGTYPVNVEKDGYEPYTGEVKVAAGGTVETLPALHPLAAAILISADLARGRVQLDDRPPAELQNGEFYAENLTAGDHALTLSDGRSEAKITFTTADGQAPVVTGPVNAKELQAVVVTGLGRSARVRGSPAPAKVSLANGTEGRSEAGVFAFSDLPHGPNQLAVGERRLAFDAGRRPLLRLAVYSDRNVGTLMVQTGLAQFRVFLDGVPYDRAIREGAMSIQNLVAKAYRIRVTADGYEAAAERETLIKKGGMTPETFKLPAVAQFSALVVRGLPPRTQVLVDGAAVGATDGDGNFSSDKIQPGERQVEFKNPPQYKDGKISRKFGARETVTITGADVRMDANGSEVTISAVPEGAALEIQCGQQALRREKANAVVSCAERSLNVKASAEGFVEETKNIPLNPGVPARMSFSLTRVPAPTVVRKQSCSAAELAAKGWVLDQGWQTPKAGGAILPCEDLAGYYDFSIRVPPKGPVLGIGPNKSVGWKLQGANTARDFVLDRKFFGAQGGSRHDISGFEKDGALTFRILVEPGRVVHQLRQGNSWQQVDSVDGDFRKVRIQFIKDTRIAGFAFAER